MNSSPRDERKSSDAAEAIGGLDETVRRNIQARDAVAMVDGYYAEDARVLPPGSGEVAGKAAILAMWKDLVAGGMVDLELITEHIHSAGDLAFGTGRARATVQGADGAAKVMEGRYAVAFRREANGQWRNIIDMYTIDSEQPAGQVAP